MISRSSFTVTLIFQRSPSTTRTGNPVARTSELSSVDDRIVSYIILEGRPLSRDISLSDEHIDHTWVHRESLPEQDLCVQFREFIDGYSRARP